MAYIVKYEASRLIASGNNGMGHGKMNRNKKLFYKGPKPDDVCNYYKEKGHWKSDFPKRKQSGFVVVGEDDTRSEHEIAIFASGKKHPSDVWVLDTIMLYHMCQRRKWFTIYVVVDSGNINMANISMTKVVGIDSIMIRMHDGRFCTLNDIIHVLSMEKNLIYVSLLGNIVFKYLSGDEILRACIGLDVILKGGMREFLYPTRIHSYRFN